MATKPFKGVIKLDVRDSVPDWEPYTPKKAPEGAPNVLFVLYDDTGLAAWSPFGGRINMPTLQKLADNGLMYSQWHTTALCSPTRSTLLTGRNHHLNGMRLHHRGGQRIPRRARPHPGRVRHDRADPPGRRLEHLLAGQEPQRPRDGRSPGREPQAVAARRRASTASTASSAARPTSGIPTWSKTTTSSTQPYTPEEGYHLSKDLADQAMQMIRDQKASNPSKPWYMWFCPGANHAPHHAPQEYIDKYKGKFDDGYEAYREWVLPRMIAKGILPEGTQLTPLNPLPDDVANPGDHVRPWNTLNADEKKLFSRLMEVYAGFSEYTDAQVGRIIDYLEKTGQLENTLVLYAADNGASGEGSPNGSVNENKFFNGYPDELAENMKLIDVLGGPDTYEHYPTGWAAATSTPFKMFKRYSEYAGGTCDPLVISWPKGIKARGEVRNQYHHSTDIVPTILEVCGLEMPKVYKGVEQYPLSGVSMRYTFDAKPDAPTQKKRQYYAMLGTRGIWEDGWKAVADARPAHRQGPLRQGRVGALPRGRGPRRVEEPGQGASREAPGADQGLVRGGGEEPRAAARRPHARWRSSTSSGPPKKRPANGTSTIPGTAPVPESVAVNVRGRSYKILADVEITDPNCSGVIFAHGSRFGGHSLFIKDKKLHYVYNFLGIQPEQQFVSPELKPGKYTLGMEFTRESAGKYHESLGKTKLYVNDKVVAEGPMRAQVGKFTLCGDGLCVGFDSADAVSQEYTGSNPFKGGTIQFVGVTIEKAQYLDLETLARAALAVD